MLGLLLFWNVLGLMFMSTEGLMIQLIMVVLYGGLVLVSFMLYSNSGGTVVLMFLLIFVSFMSYTMDSLMFFLAIIILLCVMV